MNDLSRRAALGVGAAMLVGVCAVAFEPSAVGIGFAATLLAAAAAFVAFVAQSRGLRDEARLVYRPVYVRRHDVRQRVSFRDE